MAWETAFGESQHVNRSRYTAKKLGGDLALRAGDRCEQSPRKTEAG